MNNYKEYIATLISEQMANIGSDEIEKLIEVPVDSKMGDYAFPCFRFAKEMKKAPQMIAKDIAGRIANNDYFEKVEQVNAYVNIFLNKEVMALDTLVEVCNNENYGDTYIGQNKTVVVEFSSPNIAKPFHIGHIRSTVIGNSIYKLYKAIGYNVERVNHLGDYGTQFGKMICAYRRWGNKEDVEKEPIKTLLQYYTKFHEEVEKDPSLDDEARNIFTNLENGHPEEIELWQWFRDESLKEFTTVYKMLGIEFDSYAGESFYSDKMDRYISELEAKKLLQDSQGAKIVDLEEFGMPPALIQKRDGSTLYITRDIAAAVYRKEHYDFYKNIYVVASQQNLHFQQWFKIIELLGYEWSNTCVHVPFGMVSLEDGTMSTRHGRVVFLEDVLNTAIAQTMEIVKEKNVATDDIDVVSKQVGIGAVVFNELANSRIKDYVFSWDKILNFDGETGPYVQYTYARAKSVVRKAEEQGFDVNFDINSVDAKYISGVYTHELVKSIYKMPDIIVEAAERYEPSILTRHIVDMAQNFNRFYRDEHILVQDESERNAKLLLVFATARAIKNGLELLGIDAPERM